MFNLSKNSLEVLEARIAPAAIPFLPTDPNAYVKATIGAPIELHAGQVLTTTGIANSGAYLLYVEQGNALVFFTDLNNNKNVDFNELTGISAGEGFRMVSFVDIHGDIVTNLRERDAVFIGQNGLPVTRAILSLSDSDFNPANDNLQLKGDGRVVLNKTIEKVEMRSLTINDIPDQNGDGTVDDVDVALRKAESTYSIFGSIYAGAGFGKAGDATSGLIIDSTGLQNFGFEANTKPQIGSIRTGTAASGQFFSFGNSYLDDINGFLVPFTPARGQTGGDIINVRAGTATTVFDLDGLYAGDGGIGARGGNVVNVTLNSDDNAGYDISAGTGGRGPAGGLGGSILGFSDANSDTGQVRIFAGDGGVGATGAGGTAGDFEFATFNVLGNVSIELASGGDGFTSGGNGASLGKGTFTNPLARGFTAANSFGTTHLPSSLGLTYTPRIGTHEAVDFDADGFGDYVFTTKSTSSLVVSFGAGDGTFRQTVDRDGLPIPDRIYLHGARNAEALTVGDFNGDGHPDIATASLDLGSHAGVVVFLSQFEDVNNDGILSSTEDLNHNGRNDFRGFTNPIFTPMPLLERGDPDTFNSVLPFWESPIQISALTTGDYDGDGKPELAAVVTYYALKLDDATGATISLTREFQTLVFLRADVEHNNLTNADEFTGQFYADFGTKRIESPGQPPIPADPRQPFVILSRPGGILAENIVIETTALSNGTGAFPASDHDVVIFGQKGVFPNNQGTIEYFDRPNIPFPVQIGVWGMGRVDTDRLMDDPGQTNHEAYVDMTLTDFTVVDLDNDGLADLGAISQAPVGFIIGIIGDGSGSGAQASGLGSDNGGNFIGNRGYAGTPRAAEVTLAVKSGDYDEDGQLDDLAVWHGFGDFAMLLWQPGILPTDPPTFNFPPPLGPLPPGIQDTGMLFSPLPTPSRPVQAGPVMVDQFIPNITHTDGLNLFTLGSFSLAAADLGNRNLIFHAGVSPFLFNDIENLFFRGFTLRAGDGGDSLLGNGGTGGFLGSTGRVGTTFDPITGLPIIDFIGSIFLEETGNVRLFAGQGGDGFTRGGNGGDITGITLRAATFVDPNDPTGGTFIFTDVVGSLVAGDGGRGVSSAGGDGGTLSNNSIEEGVVFFAGDGGPGRIGGHGGFVLGNSTSINDTILTLRGRGVNVVAGDGGDGTRRGGDAGSILQFHPFILAETDLGRIRYVGGNGGNAVSGPGGTGGSVLDSSPQDNVFIERDIFVQAGSGGDGTTGGNGGSIDSFNILLAAPSKAPGLLTFIAGDGGFGTSGNGGIGGSISNINVPSRGLPTYQDFTIHDFDRMVAGNGGGSASKRGGAGGSVHDVITSSDQGGYAIIAGAGGDGLRRGGRGGDILNVDVAFGASSTAKGLFISGAGGAASAFVVNPRDNSPNQPQNSFGGQVGRGGDGGNISGVTQRGNIDIHVDLISGNGGDTINYGTVIDPAPNVGRGGSISNVIIAGNIGNIDPTVAIQSYNNFLGGETVAKYVDRKFRDPLAPAGPSLSDADGNVGIIVGAAGRNKAVVLDPQGHPHTYVTQPSTGARNGDLINLTTRNLMSAVAGSVDRIAAIQTCMNIQILNGQVGSDKGIINVAEYLDADGNPTVNGRPVRDGRLLDGALICKALLDGGGNNVTLPGRVFFL